MALQNTDIVTAIQNNGKLLGQIQQAIAAISATATTSGTALATMATQQTAMQVDLVNLVTQTTALVTATNAVATALAALFPAPKNSSAAWSPGSVTNGTQVTQNITVSGAALGDYVEISVSVDLQAQILTAYVSAVNTVTAVLRNDTAAPINLGAITLFARTYTH